MTNLRALIDQLKQVKVVPVINPPTVETGLNLAEILVENNFPIAEITFRTDHATETVYAINKKFPELLLVAGTVLSTKQANAAVTAGASAIVSPGFTPHLGNYCKSNAIPFIPGVCTPSEIQKAAEAGITNLKFFPAALSGGVKMLNVFKDVYPNIRFMPTGGISIDNIQEYLAVSNVLCCGGTWLSPADLMLKGDWDAITKRITEAVKLVNQ